MRDDQLPDKVRGRSLTIFLKTVFLTAVCSMAFGYLVSKAERGGSVKGARNVILAVARFPDLVRMAFSEMKAPGGSNYIQENPFGYCGIKKVEENFTDSNYVLLSFYHESLGKAEIQLMEIDGGKKVHCWIPPESEIMSHQNNKEAPGARKISHKNFAAIHPLLLDSGAVVFTLMYGPLVKLNKKGEIEWIKEGYYHHSLELDADGNIWACNDETKEKFNSLFKFKGKLFEENLIVKLSPAGEVLFEKSVDDILLENELAGLLYGSGEFEFDPVHLNDVQPALTDSRYWKKGDLLISIRNKSCVFLYRPAENRIVWLKQGDWVNQHDVNFVNSTRISLFGNDMVRYRDEERTFSLRGHNDLYVIDLSTGSVTKPYSEVFDQLNIYTAFEGRASILENGRIFIEETYPGRLAICDENGPLWLFTKCFPPDLISGFGWCRYIPREDVNLDFLTDLK